MYLAGILAILLFRGSWPIALSSFAHDSLALPCGVDNIANIEVDNVKDLLTEFNLMTYDFYGSWDAKTGINAPLYNPANPDMSVDGCVKNWLDAGASRDKLNIGLPFYGRSYLGKDITGKDQNFAGAADTGTWTDDEGTPQYFNIVKKINEFTSVRDEDTKTQIAYNAESFLSYDDELAICDKTEYALNEDLHGFIIWEIRQVLFTLQMATPSVGNSHYLSCISFAK